MNENELNIIHKVRNSIPFNGEVYEIEKQKGKILVHFYDHFAKKTGGQYGFRKYITFKDDEIIDVNIKNLKIRLIGFIQNKRI